jgi:nucleoside-diphosphate-sugar epimerase
MIAVTGANGLLGSFIVRELIRTDKKFFAIARHNSDTSLLRDVSDKMTWRTADVSDAVALEEALDGATSVIHAAAMVSFNPAYANRIMDININGTRNVVDICLDKNISRLVHVSSVAALGRDASQQLIDETNKWSDNSLNSTYAESKYFAEVEVFRGHEEGLRTVVVNPSVILAPADWYKSSAQLFKYVWDERSFYIDGYLNYVDVRDVASAIVQLHDSDVNGERFILNAGSVSFEKFFNEIATRFHKKPPSVKLRKRTLKVAAFADNIRAKMLGKEPLITRETARLAGTSFHYSSKKIQNTLNFRFKSIDETLDWCCNHYLNFIAKN